MSSSPLHSIFEPATRDALLQRIERLTSEALPQWGTMSAYQMVRHCMRSERMYQGEVRLKRTFVGRLFGRMALKSPLKDEAPLGKNAPTHPTFKITEEGDLEPVKQAWMALLRAYGERPASAYAGFVHPFFGAMDREQIGQMVYKHTDHHLRQFGV
ncbi:MAG: DUF1569 domain-containing protein [Bacteroidota bacterium]